MRKCVVPVAVVLSAAVGAAACDGGNETKGSRKATTQTTETTEPPTTMPATGYPSPTSTGWQPIGVTLSRYRGPNTITRAGTVIDGKDISGGLTIKADNVTVRRSRVRAGGGSSYVIFQSSGFSGLVIEDTEVTNIPGQVADRAVSSKGQGMTLTRDYVHGTQRGIETGTGTTVQGSYSDDFNNASGTHATGVMSLGGTDHVTLRGNAFGCGPGECSSAMTVYPQPNFGGPNDDWTIDGNLFNGGSYCVYLGYSPSEGEQPNANMRVTNNGFGTKYFPDCGPYGPVASWSRATGNTWTDNHWYAPGDPKDGQPVT